jgi:hypothetical protein
VEKCRNRFPTTAAIRVMGISTTIVSSLILRRMPVPTFLSQRSRRAISSQLVPTVWQYCGDILDRVIDKSKDTRLTLRAHLCSVHRASGRQPSTAQNSMAADALPSGCHFLPSICADLNSRAASQGDLCRIRARELPPTEHRDGVRFSRAEVEQLSALTRIPI